MHLIMLGVVLVGFGRTFYLHDLFFTKPLPSRLILHGVALTCWFCLVAAQGLLVQSGRRDWHTHIAWLAAPTVVGVVATGAWVNTSLALTLKSARDPANMFIWANYTSLLSFAVLVAWAVASRRRQSPHRRLMLFASIAIVGPAFARFAFWPGIGLGMAWAPALAGAGMLAMVLSAIAYDFAATRRMQAATSAGLAGIVVPMVAGMAIAVSGIGFRWLHP